MDLLWMILPVFLVCAAGQTATEIKVELGQDLMLNCSINNEILRWYMEIHSEIRVCVVHIVRNNCIYYVSNSKSKYEVSNYRLIIKNISAEDCRLYFCGKRENDQIRFSDAFRVISDPQQDQTVDISIPAQNNTEPQHTQTLWQDELLKYGSFGLKVLLVIVGLVCACVYLNRRNCRCLVNDPPPGETPEMTEAPQNDDMQLNPLHPPWRRGSLNRLRRNTDAWDLSTGVQQ